MKSGADILTTLRVALSTNGDFPERMRAISELRVLVSNPNTSVNQVASHILQEPTLGTRILQLVNSAIYRRQTPILTVSQAIVQVGMRTLSELFASLVLCDQFTDAAKEKPEFAEAFQRAILTGVLAGACGQAVPDQSAPEKAYLAGIFSELGPLLFYFYFPELGNSVESYRKERKCDRSTALRHVTNLSASDLNAAVLDALGIPSLYKDILVAAEIPPRSTPPADSPATLGIIIRNSSEMASEWMDSNRGAVEKLFKDLKTQLPFLGQLHRDFLKRSAESFSQNCTVLGITPSNAVASDPAQDAASQKSSAEAQADAAFAIHLQALEQACYSTKSLAELITQAMEAVIFGLKYDRTYLFLTNTDKTALRGRVALGEGIVIPPLELNASLETNSNSNIVLAFRSGSPQILGTPLLPTKDEHLAIPVGTRPEGLGVIYAERDSIRASSKPKSRISDLNLLAQLLEQAIVQREKK